MNHKDKIYVAGHRGMVGSAIVRNLQAKGYHNIVSKTSSELDLRNQEAVKVFFETEKPDHVFLAAAKVGGIHANSTYKADFIHDNLAIQTNIIKSAYDNGVGKLLFLGSSCIYPRDCAQPIKENYLLTGPLEKTNEPYALAKITGLKMCEYFMEQYGANYISAMPTNLYGPNDNYHLENSHVLPALIRKFHEAKERNSTEVEVWGDGTPLREFLYVDDLAEACYFLMQNYGGAQHVNVGTGQEISIGDLAKMIKEVVDFKGELVFQTDKPNGTPRKLLDVSKLADLGWKASISLREGVERTYKIFQTDLKNQVLKA